MKMFSRRHLFIAIAYLYMLKKTRKQRILKDLLGMINSCKDEE